MENIEKFEKIADLEHQYRQEAISVRLQPMMMDPKPGQAEGAKVAMKRAEDRLFEELDKLTEDEKKAYGLYRKIAFGIPS